MTAVNDGRHADAPSTDHVRTVESRRPNLFAVVLTVLLAAVIPALWNFSLVYNIPQSVYLFVYFLFGLLSWPLGLASAHFRRRPHLWASLVLAVVAACVEYFLLLEVATILSNIKGQPYVMRLEDAISVIGTGTLFFAGALLKQRKLLGHHRDGTRAGSNKIQLIRLMISAVGLILHMFVAFS